ncbi:hypothetical protein L5515_008835 [Caenorhabditis briggsae]|uniref:Uncharacterized protein n=1 Tax=Caenorhabditis briggsae TaxID=6238 RepID=A0AAE9JLG8_CAEBR|nr:hypothetical protein L5515_008835 [Caenorhabditis briggsae]
MLGICFILHSDHSTLGETWLLFFFLSTLEYMHVQSQCYLFNFSIDTGRFFDTIKLRYFKGWRFSFCVLHSSVFGVLWALGLYYFDQMDEYSEQYMEKDLLERHNLSFSEISSLALVTFNADGSLRCKQLSYIAPFGCIMECVESFSRCLHP